MKINCIAVVMALALSLASPIQAQTDTTPNADTRTQELVDQLKEVIRGAEQSRGANQPLIKQLRDLVRRYDWPWQVSLLYDDFRDGDYTYNPRWIVNQGEFWVARGGGLRSSFDPTASKIRRTSDRTSGNSALDILGEILLAGRERDANPSQVGFKAEGEIFTRVGISNSFVVKVQLNMKNYAERNTRLEFGPFQGDNRLSGYRLAYDSGGTPSVSLIRFGPNRSAVIEIVDQGIELQDGNSHTVEWRRGSDGEMVVFVDDKRIIRTVDRAYDESFDGFSVVNKGGDFEIKQVSIFGTQQ